MSNPSSTEVHSATRKLGLVVPVLRNFQGLAALMASVDVPLQPYVVDNWTINRGVARAWNEGLRRALDDRCTHILVSNDDIVFGPGTIAGLADFLDDPQRAGVVIASAQDVGWQRHYGASWEQTRGTTVADGADYSCFMVRPDFPDKVGWFDENYYPAYFEDNDMEYRLRRANCQSARVTWCPTHHRVGGTQYMFGNMPVVSNGRFRNNERYYAEKWGGLPGHERFLTPYALPERDLGYWRPADLNLQLRQRTSATDLARGLYWRIKTLHRR